MANPETRLTAFHFYFDSFEQLPEKLRENVGYNVKSNDVWSINITPFELKRFSCTLTVIYWDEKRVAKRLAAESQKD